MTYMQHNYIMQFIRRSSCFWGEGGNRQDMAGRFSNYIVSNIITNIIIKHLYLFNVSENMNEGSNS